MQKIRNNFIKKFVDFWDDFPIIILKKSAVLYCTLFYILRLFFFIF
jgi:hypothetical protein